MNNEQRQFVGESYIEMYQSLIDSVKQAGGDETAFYYDEIKDMSISTLFNKLATNGIRFTRVIPEEQKKKDENSAACGASALTDVLYCACTDYGG